MFGLNLNDKLPALHPTSPKAIRPIREQDTRTKAKSKQYHNKNKVASPTLKVGYRRDSQRDEEQIESTLSQDSIQSSCS